jgi:hypothetical protein
LLKNDLRGRRAEWQTALLSGSFQKAGEIVSYGELNKGLRKKSPSERVLSED